MLVCNKFRISIFCIALALFSTNTNAVTRSCNSSNVLVTGTVFITDSGSYIKRTISAEIPRPKIIREGSHWYPPTARRRACRKASKVALEQLLGLNIDASTIICDKAKREYGDSVVLSSRPELFSVDAWHGTENNSAKFSVSERNYNSCLEQIGFSEPKLSIYFQNMGLLVFPASYGGLDRTGAVTSLIQHVRSRNYDVIALAEAFSDGERDRISRALPVYKYRMDGPEGPWYDFRSDGGLMLLSRFPITEKSSRIFRNAKGLDWFALKGILHARIFIPESSENFDLFVTHLQNDDEGGTDLRLQTTLSQSGTVERFVKRNTGKKSIALIMGDFNLDAFIPSIVAARKQQMPESIDLWESCFGYGPGITYDELSDFKSGKMVVPLADRQLSTRSSKGQRLDYIFRWSSRAVAGICNIRRVTQQFASENTGGQFRDVSDHYGLHYSQ